MHYMMLFLYGFCAEADSHNKISIRIIFLDVNYSLALAYYLYACIYVVIGIPDFI